MPLTKLEATLVNVLRKRVKNETSVTFIHQDEDKCRSLYLIDFTVGDCFKQDDCGVLRRILNDKDSQDIYGPVEAINNVVVQGNIIPNICPDATVQQLCSEAEAVKVVPGRVLENPQVPETVKMVVQQPVKGEVRQPVKRVRVVQEPVEMVVQQAVPMVQKQPPLLGSVEHPVSKTAAGTCDPNDSSTWITEPEKLELLSRYASEANALFEKYKIDKSPETIKQAREILMAGCKLGPCPPEIEQQRLESSETPVLEKRRKAMDADATPAPKRVSIEAPVVQEQASQEVRSKEYAPKDYFKRMPGPLSFGNQVQIVPDTEAQKIEIKRVDDQTKRDKFEGLPNITGTTRVDNLKFSP